MLVLVSSDRLCTFADLISTLAGNFYSQSGDIDPIYKNISEGRIQEDKYIIDLYVFKDDFSVVSLRNAYIFGATPPTIFIKPISPDVCASVHFSF